MLHSIHSQEILEELMSANKNDNNDYYEYNENDNSDTSDNNSAVIQLQTKLMNNLLLSCSIFVIGMVIYYFLCK